MTGGGLVGVDMLPKKAFTTWGSLRKALMAFRQNASGKPGVTPPTTPPSGKA
jgi:hypothetical protein